MLTKNIKNKRKLGYIEEFYEEANYRVNGFGVSTIIAKLLGNLSVEKFKQALFALHATEPFLQAKIVKNNNEFWFAHYVEFENIPINILSLEENDWENVSEKEMATPIDSSSHLWRVNLLVSKKIKNMF